VAADQPTEMTLPDALGMAVLMHRDGALNAFASHTTSSRSGVSGDVGTVA
jgi:hypothetical protein